MMLGEIIALNDLDDQITVRSFWILGAREKHGYVHGGNSVTRACMV